MEIPCTLLRTHLKKSNKLQKLVNRVTQTMQLKLKINLLEIHRIYYSFISPLAKNMSNLTVK